MSAIPVTELACSRRFRKALLYLQDKKQFQLVAQFKRSRRGHLMLLIWRLPANVQLTQAALSGVEHLLKPAAVFSELDVFSVGEDSVYPEDEALTAWEIAELFPNFVFDHEVH